MVTIYPNLVEAESTDGMPVFVGYIHGKLRFNSKGGGADIRRNHPAQRSIFGIQGIHPTLMANQSEYYIAYEDNVL